ncbi:MAG TPA: S8 family serine peptidase, partial [Acidimicrobiia bacterium]|nr:S8 family serine peptidase [Acidimicrobiia bacterium]
MKRALIVLTALATALALAVPAFSATEDGQNAASGDKTVEQGEYDSYIVVMKADPLVATEDREDLKSQRAQRKADQLRGSHREALEESGIDSAEIVNDYVNALNGFSATLTHAEATKVAGHPDVALVVPDELQQPTTDSSPTFIGLDDPAGPWMTGYDGENVVVGIIDSGIWPEHPSFADDGSYGPSPVETVLPCEVGNDAHNPDDAEFTCNNKLLGRGRCCPPIGPSSAPTRTSSTRPVTTTATAPTPPRRRRATPGSTPSC